MTRARQSGFTLLEALVAVAVLGLVVLALSQGLRFGLIASRTQERLATEIQDMDAADRLIRRMIERIFPGTEDTAAVFQGTPGSMTFRSELPLAAGPETARRVDASLGLDDRHQLVLRWVHYVHAQRLTAPVPATAVLIAGLERVELAYWGRARPGTAPAWFSAWTGATRPELIRLRLIYPPGSGRSWPDIIAAPRAERAFE